MASADALFHHFYELPPAIQRKCFSSLERRRIAQHPTVPVSSKPPGRTLPSRIAHVAFGKSHHHAPAHPSGNRCDDTGDEAECIAPSHQWLLTLPEKARRIHFSSEEQQLLACSKAPPRPRTQHADTALEKLFDRPDRCLKIHSASVPASPCNSLSDVWLEVIDDMSSRRKPSKAQDEVQRSGTFLDSSRDDTLDAAASQGKRPRRGSFRKTISHFADLGVRRLSVDSLRPSGLRTQRSSWSHTRGSSAQAPYMPQAPTQYYQDPDARMKLKIYLGSPQKFEEALEYGFPTAARNENVAPPRESRDERRRRAVRTHPASNDAHKFLRDNTLSFLDDDVFDLDDEDDDSSLPDVDGPITPAEADGTDEQDEEELDDDDVDDRLPRQSDARPSGFRYQEQGAQDPWMQAREMTLRMTLTRPDLRAADEQIYAMQRPSWEYDPFALEPLPQLEDHAAVGKEPGKIRSLFKKIKPGGHRR